MNSTCLNIFILALAFACGPAFAQTLPEQFTIEGRLSDSGTALSGAVDIKFEIVDSAVANASCVLFRETHSVTLGAQGIFALKLGAGASQYHPVPLSTVFTNGISQSGIDVSTSAPCSFTPTAGSARQVKMYVSQSGGPWTYLGPDTLITTVPTAMVAETLQGKQPSNFVQIQNDVTQAHVEEIFSTTNYPKLTDLLSGTSSSYLPSTPTSAVSFNGQQLTNVASPVAGADATNKTYVDGNIGGKTADLSGVGPATGDGYTLIWDKDAGQWTTGVPSAMDNTKLPLDGSVAMSGTLHFDPLIGTGIDLNGNDLLSTGHITMSPLKTLTLGAFTSADETTLIGMLTAVNAGASWYNTTTNTFKIWDGTTAISQTFNGATAGGDLTGTYPNPTIANDKILSDMIDSAGVSRNLLVISDQTTGDTLKFVTCNTNEVLRYEDVNGWVCRDPSTIVTFPVSSVNGKDGGAIVLDADDLGLGTASLKNFGTDPGNVPLLDGTGRIPAALLPAGTGTITEVAAGIGLSGGGTSGTVTLGLADTVVTPGAYGAAGKVATFTVDQQGRLTAAAQTDISVGDANITGVDGSKVSGDISGDAAGFTGNLAGDVTGPQGTTVVEKIQGRAVAATSPAAAEVLMWNDINSQWEPTVMPSAPVSSVAGKTGTVTLDYGDLNNAPGKYLTYKPNDVPCNNGELLKFDGTNWVCTAAFNLGLGNFMKDGSVAMTGNLKLGANYIGNDGGVNEGLAFDTNGNATFTGHVSATQVVSESSITATYSPSGSSLPQGASLIVANADAQNANGSYAVFRTKNGSGNTQDAYIGTFSTAGGTSYSPTIVFGRQSSATNYAESMRIDESGNVGIGTTSPSRLLHVQGSMRLSPSTPPSSGVAGDLVVDITASNALKFYDGTAWKTLSGGGGGNGDFMKDGSVAMTGDFDGGTHNLTNIGAINSTGIGIGTTAPLSPLTVSAAAGTYGQISVRDPGSNSSDASLKTFIRGYDNVDNPVWQLGVLDNSSNTIEFGAWDSFHSVALKTKNMTRLVIDPDGNVGIGTTAPKSTFDVRTVSNPLAYTTGPLTGSLPASLGVNSTTGWPQAGLLALDNEVMAFSVANTNTINITQRGQLGTIPADHASQTPVALVNFVSSDISGKTGFLTRNDGVSSAARFTANTGEFHGSRLSGVTLSGISGTSIPLVSINVGPTNGWPSGGVMIVDSEMMSYYVVDSNNIRVTGRGLYGTTPVSHSSPSTVTFANLITTSKASTYPFAIASFVSRSDGRTSIQGTLETVNGPYGLTLPSSLNPYDNNISLYVGSTAGWPPGGLMVIDHEILSYNLKDPNTIQITGRGLYDTTPATHNLNAPIAFINTLSSSIPSGSAKISYTRNDGGAFFSGNVGIGTAAPNYPLSVISAGNNPTVYIENSGMKAALAAYATGTTINNNAIYGNSGGSSAAIYGDSSGAGAAIYGNATGSGAAGYFTNSNGAALVTVTGNVGIGTISPFYKLDVVGDINGTCIRAGGSTVSGTCTSDQRLKTDIQSFNLGMDALQGIVPHYFKYNGLGEHPESSAPELGVIAQEVERTAPQLIITKDVKLHPDDTQTTQIKQVNYTAFIYVLINSVKELYQQMLGHDREIASIKADNQKLKEENAALKAWACSKDPSASFCN